MRGAQFGEGVGEVLEFFIELLLDGWGGYVSWRSVVRRERRLFTGEVLDGEGGEVDCYMLRLEHQNQYLPSSASVGGGSGELRMRVNKKD